MLRRLGPKPNALQQILSTTDLGLSPAPIWTGEKTDVLCIDLATGGLGDAIRTWRLGQTALRLERTQKLILRSWPNRQALWPNHTFVAPLAPLPNCPFLPAVHVLIHRSKQSFPRQSVLQSAGKLVQIPYFDILQTKCVSTSNEKTLSKCQQNGWKGAPIVILQLDDTKTQHNP